METMEWYYTKAGYHPVDLNTILSHDKIYQAEAIDIFLFHKSSPTETHACAGWIHDALHCHWCCCNGSIDV
jgi:hypothetical protein